MLYTKTRSSLHFHFLVPWLGPSVPDLDLDLSLTICRDQRLHSIQHQPSIIMAACDCQEQEMFFIIYIAVRTYNISYILKWMMR